MGSEVGSEGEPPVGSCWVRIWGNWGNQKSKTSVWYHHAKNIPILPKGEKEEAFFCSVDTQTISHRQTDRQTCTVTVTDLIV